jgi:hypothetical protein
MGQDDGVVLRRKAANLGLELGEGRGISGGRDDRRPGGRIAREATG